MFMFNVYITKFILKKIKSLSSLSFTTILNTKRLIYL